MITAQLDLVYIAKGVEMVKVSSNVGETIINHNKPPNHHK